MELKNLQEQWTASEMTIIFKAGYKIENPLANAMTSFMFLRSVWDKELLPLQCHCMAFFLDRKGRTVAYRPISTGSMSNITVDIRLIACLAVRTLADSVITAIGRPSGVMTPSAADLTLVKKLKEGLDLLNVKLLDHFLLCGTNYLSFHDEGLL